MDEVLGFSCSNASLLSIHEKWGHLMVNCFDIKIVVKSSATEIVFQNLEAV